MRPVNLGCCGYPDAVYTQKTSSRMTDATKKEPLIKPLPPMPDYRVWTGKRERAVVRAIPVEPGLGSRVFGRP